MWGNRNKPETGRRGITPVENDITVYGTTWCGMTQIVRRYLDRTGLQYRYLDLEEDPDAEKQLRWITGGYTNHPTVVVDGQVLIEPDIDELQAILAGNGYI
ncbi:MAG TPA: glutaredoxin family protein [Bacteroidales bacterium]|jgi:mycoredoxin|nr:glutaredoxin family protein [Bacteroidales bacterium]